jgi:hypothetical protein
VTHFSRFEVEPREIIPVIAQLTSDSISKIGIISIRVFVDDGRIGSECVVAVDVGLDKCLSTSLDLLIEASDIV